MARKNADIKAVSRALQAPAFGNTDSSQLPAALDPLSPTTLVLRVSEIKAYEHNPRHAENREYPRLKDSIRSRRGLTTPLTVTKRPGEDRYTIAAGGNSRLRILQQLAEETGDEAFAVVMCQFEPWSTECQVLANHLIENDIRGSILFGDKASAIVAWRKLYEEAHPEEAPLAQRMLADRLIAAGYRIPQSLLSRLLFAAENLLPHLPMAFSSGLGRQTVEQIIRLRNCGLQVWQDNVTQSDQQQTGSAFDTLFAEACAQQDCHCADWDHDGFQRALSLRIAESLDVDHKLVTLDIDSLYHGYPIDASSAASAPPASAKDPQGLQSDWAFERVREIEAKKMERARARLELRASTPGGSESDEGEEERPFSQGARPPDGPTDARNDSRRLREGNYLVARQLAQSHDLDPFVKPSATGFGFFIEAPEPSAVPPESRDQATGPGQGLVLTGLRSGLWWLLCLAADQLSPTPMTAFGQAYPASWLVELFTALPTHSPDTDPNMALNILVGEPSAQGLVADVLTDPAFSEENLSALNQLLHGCRALRTLAADDKLLLWDMEA